MEAFEFSIRSNIKEIQKKLGAFAYQQVPFASAAAVTSLAKLVRDAEVKNIQSTFKNPSPFTVKSVRMTAARKGSPVATVFVMDKAAQYLEPYEDGGTHHLASNALLNPKDVALNQYGQLRKGTLAALKARSDIFIGEVKTKHGMVNGVWQRSAEKATVRRMKGGKLVVANAKRGFNTSGQLKLLIRFGDALPVKERLHYRARAQKVVDMNVDREFGRALAKAMATAR
jgi:hypothetical protein